MSVPTILRKIFAGLDPAPAVELTGFEPRDYCVQYRESTGFRQPADGGGGDPLFLPAHAQGHQLILANRSEINRMCPSIN